MSSRVTTAVLAVLVLVVPSLALAQNAGRSRDTQLQIEAKRQRLVVRPDPPLAAAVRDAERVAGDTAAAEIVREENAPVRRRPQLDYDVTSAVQARNLRR
jgi:hypothetical protein